MKISAVIHKLRIGNEILSVTLHATNEYMIQHESVKYNVFVNNGVAGMQTYALEQSQFFDVNRHLEQVVLRMCEKRQVGEFTIKNNNTIEEIVWEH